MSAASSLGLPEALERAASALRSQADRIRPANGDPAQLLELLDADDAASVLEWLMVHEPEAGAELADSWSEGPAGGAAPLLRVDSEALPKAGKKVLRRALHRLRSRGVALPEKGPSQVVAKLPPIGDDLETAMISGIDPRGTRIAYLAETHPSGGVRLFEIMLDEERGVLECEAYTTGRSKARKFLREFGRREGFTAIEAPPESVRALVERIASRQLPDRPLPRAFSEWRSRVAAPPDGTATPGELARAALGGDAEPGQVERAAELVRKRELGPWPPESELLNEVAERLAEVGRGRIIVSEPHRREQVNDVLQETLGRVFAERFASATAQRFEESAYVLWKGGAVEDAKACLATARVFREKAPGDNPVARTMLEVLLEPVLSKLEEETKSEEERSLLVKP
jgi:hypothetical protein